MYTKNNIIGVKFKAGTTEYEILEHKKDQILLKAENVNTPWWSNVDVIGYLNKGAYTILTSVINNSYPIY